MKVEKLGLWGRMGKEDNWRMEEPGLWDGGERWDVDSWRMMTEDPRMNGETGWMGGNENGRRITKEGMITTKEDDDEK